MYKTIKNWDLNLSTKFSSWKSKKCYEQTLEQDRDLIECFSVKRRSENSLESVKIEDDIAAPNHWVFFCEKEAWEYLEWWVELVSKELNHFGVIAGLFQQIGVQ